MTQFRGSRKNILDLIESPTYLKKMNELIKGTDATVSAKDKWKPLSKDKAQKEKLNNFLNDNFSSKLGDEFLAWWMKNPGPSARTPFFDIISTCTIKGKKGILIVEGRVHSGELAYNSKKKYLNNDVTIKALENDKSISKAIAEANKGISKTVKGVKISTDECYHLSNRIAHAWWLANKGIPVVLLYLGFLNFVDLPFKKNITFNSDEEWQDMFRTHASKIGVDKLLGTWVDCGAESFITISKSI